jgi:hypothetical protein
VPVFWENWKQNFVKKAGIWKTALTLFFNPHTPLFTPPTPWIIHSLIQQF